MANRADHSRVQDAKRVRVIVFCDERDRAESLRQALLEWGGVVVGELTTSCDFSAEVALRQPDIILVDADVPTRQMLGSLERISRDHPLPVVLFTQSSDVETTRCAIRVGVSAYVVGSMSLSRLPGVIDVAIVRFDEHQALLAEIEETKLRLADRCDIDRAKTMLMMRRKLSEPDAYGQLRRIAMDRQLRIGDVARSLLVDHRSEVPG